MSWYVTCPHCDFVGDSDDDFEMNLCDECFCPKCGEKFELDSSGDEGENDDEE